jgi:peptidoglycan/xylan/chitin deacetylase (PgdA/CDA1 family)
MTAPDHAARLPAIALMYHAIEDPCAPGEGSDPHYSVSAEAFAAQLDLLLQHAGVVTCAREWFSGAVQARAVITFDDGHASNHSVALPLLQERGLHADFFVNPGRVGEAGCASWSDLAEMAAAGMSIQSHGWNHRYFTELAPAALREDLLRSRRTIEDRLGQPVTLLAPPGGRMPPNLAALARECGYAHVLGSEPGRLDLRNAVQPRMAVTASTSVQRIAGWLEGRGLARAQARYRTLALAKRMLGDGRYERLRGRLLGQAGGGA